MTYLRQGLGALVLAALQAHPHDDSAEQKADNAQTAVNHLSDQFAALTQRLASDETTLEASQQDLANMAADLDDLAGTLQNSNALVGVAPVEDTDVAHAEPADTSGSNVAGAVIADHDTGELASADDASPSDSEQG